MRFVFKIGIGILFLVCSVSSVNYSNEEKNGLILLRDRMGDKLYEPYMKSDFYLITFLRAKKLNVDLAVAMLTKCQNWRIMQRMDKVLNETEPWDELHKSLPYRSDGIDKSGSPLLEIPVGKWDTRKTVVAGKGDLYVHHITRAFEDAFQKVRQTNTINPNVTQWVILYDLNGYNSKQHACLACIPRQTQFVAEYEANYPLRMKKAWVVNTPKIFENLFKILKTVMTEETKNAIEIHGFDKREWGPKIWRGIDRSQLLPIFGGTKQ